MLFRLGLQPDRVERRQDQIEGQRLRDDAAAGRQHHQLLAREQLRQRGLLHAAKAFLAVQRDDLGDREPVLRLDLLVELDKAPADLLRQHPPERGLAGAAQADQRDAGERGAAWRQRAAAGEHVLGLRDLARRRLAQEISDHRPIGHRLARGDQVLEMRAHRACDTAQQHDRDIAFAALQLGDVAFGNAGDFCEHLARHAGQAARGAHPLAELFEEVGFRIVGCGHDPCDQDLKKLGLAYADEEFKTLSPEEYTSLKPEVRNWYGAGLSWVTRFWMDDMYMITAVQAKAYEATNNRKYIDRAGYEMVAYLDTLQNPDGLFYHAPDVPYYWGRGDGWLAAGMADLLKILPKDNPHRPRIMKGYLNMMGVLLKHQDANGMWHQLINDPNSWPETSCTGMFTYAFIVGVKQGWLPSATYGKAARKAWIKLQDYVNENGDLTEICEGTNKKNDHQYYLDRKRIVGDLHGQGPLLWCVNALLEK